ncbi:helix-turn-helix domain-containing protein [Methylobacterium sp. NEAU 140]|uniref:helix-turn-helix domain-containing protein n=1 Tax=Methylobacterium sp. NEAU 140 TaxID=3064945 RepID=UPI00273541F5|nr:helix-turn-helix domain-containing protein [Methylobacterium sp. NEAU 140]MDP4021044.1 helix-turn-helix domain-containing protein [Methylobacterium sp. NEAU 140]
MQDSQARSLAEDMIEGAGPIAKFLFGSEDTKARRKIYHIIEQHDFPSFKIGGKIYARRSSILAWLAAKEKRAA